MAKRLIETSFTEEDVKSFDKMLEIAEGEQGSVIEQFLE